METEKQDARKKIGQRIKELRAKHRLTQEELAAKMDVRIATVCDWENGVRMPRAEVVGRLFEILGTFSLGE